MRLALLRGRALAALLGATLAAAACSSGSDGSTAPTTSTQTVSALQTAGGDGQTVAVGATSAPLQVRAVNEAGTGVSGIVVRWAIASGTGTLSATLTTTDANGLASTKYSGGTDAGDVLVSASALGTIPKTFHITITP